MSEPLLRLDGLGKSYGALRVTDGVSLSLEPGEICAIIGPNGAGKTTLLHQISGFAQPDEGRVLFAGEDVTALRMAARVGRGLARSFQITSILQNFSALENIALAIQARSGSSFRLHGLAAREPALNAPAMALLEQFGLADRADVAAASLSYGEKRQLDLALAFATGARCLLLDEPLAGASRQESRRIVDTLQALKGKVAMLLVEHDMEAVFSLADRVGVLVYGRLIAVGPPAAIRADAAVRAAYLGEEAA